MQNIFKENSKMSYVEQTLSEDEEIREKFEVHPIYYELPKWIFIVLFVVVAIVLTTIIDDGHLIAGPILSVPALPFLWCYFWFKSIEMVVTNKRVVFKRGIIAVNTKELKNAKVESIEIRQGIIGRFCNCGDIRFSGTGTTKFSFRGVYKPWEAKRRIEGYIGD